MGHRKEQSQGTQIGLRRVGWDQWVSKTVGKQMSTYTLCEDQLPYILFQTFPGRTFINGGSIFLFVSSSPGKTVGRGKEEQPVLQDSPVLRTPTPSV